MTTEAAPLSAEETARLVEFARACKAAARAVGLYPGGHPSIGATLGRIVRLTSAAGLGAPLRISVLTDTLLLTVKKHAVLTEIDHDSRFALRMLAGISRRLHGLVHDVQAYALHSGAQRVIGYLLRDQAAEDCVSGEVFTVSLPVSKATIASRLSLTPEYFSRVLHDLEDAGLIEIDKRDIRILDARRLAEHPLH